MNILTLVKWVNIAYFTFFLYKNFVFCQLLNIFFFFRFASPVSVSKYISLNLNIIPYTQTFASTQTQRISMSLTYAKREQKKLKRLSSSHIYRIILRFLSDTLFRNLRDARSTCPRSDRFIQKNKYTYSFNIIFYMSINIDFIFIQ